MTVKDEKLIPIVMKDFDEDGEEYFDKDEALKILKASQNSIIINDESTIRA